MSASEMFDGLKVMVIDDSNTIRRSAEIFLGKTGARVVLAEDGFDALAKIADHQPDLIFCDVMMPRLDGYQTCALIKKSPKFKTTPVVMLSSKDGLFDKAKGRMVGSDHYLTKPFTKDSLLQAVSEYARKIQSTQPLAAESAASTTVAAEMLSSTGAAAAAPGNSSAPMLSLELPSLEAMPAAPVPVATAPVEAVPELRLSTGPDIGQLLENFPQPAIDLIGPTEKFTLSLV